MTRKLVMVGGPYSGATPEEVERNIVATELLGVEIARLGGAPVVPNSMGRTIQAGKGSPDYEICRISLATRSPFLWQTSFETTQILMWLSSTQKTCRRFVDCVLGRP